MALFVLHEDALYVAVKNLPQLNWEVLEYEAYRTNLAPFDFAISGLLKKLYVVDVQMMSR